MVNLGVWYRRALTTGSERVRKAQQTPTKNLAQEVVFSQSEA